MGRVRDYRMLTGLPTAPTHDGTPNKIGMFTNASGILLTINETGTIFTAGQQWTGNLNMMTGTLSVATGVGFFRGNAAVSVTGNVYGSTGTGPMTTVLGSPSAWLPVIGVSGENYVIPAYTYS